MLFLLECVVILFAAIGFNDIVGVMVAVVCILHRIDTEQRRSRRIEKQKAIYRASMQEFYDNNMCEDDE